MSVTTSALSPIIKRCIPESSNWDSSTASQILAGQVNYSWDGSKTGIAASRIAYEWPNGYSICKYLKIEIPYDSQSAPGGCIAILTTKDLGVSEIYNSTRTAPSSSLNSGYIATSTIYSDSNCSNAFATEAWGNGPCYLYFNLSSTTMSAGTTYYVYIVRNNSSARCSLYGKTSITSTLDYNDICTIEYYYDSSSTKPVHTQTYTYAETGTTRLDKVNISRTGYSQTSWHLHNSSDPRHFYNLEQEWNLSNNGNYRLDAVWTPYTYTVTYDANGGSDAPEPQSYEYAESGYTNLSSSEPIREGYTFLGWSLSDIATSASYRAGHEWLLNNTANYTLFAVWVANKYNVVYEGNGGLTETYLSYYYDEQTYNQSFQIRDNEFKREGYRFIGWKDDNGNWYIPGTSYSNLTTVPEGKAYLYAQWEPLATIFVEVGSSYKAGTPYVKVGNKWKKATAVYVKVGNEWKLSTR